MLADSSNMWLIFVFHVLMWATINSEELHPLHHKRLPQDSLRSPLVARWYKICHLFSFRLVSRLLFAEGTAGLGRQYMQYARYAVIVVCIKLIKLTFHCTYRVMRDGRVHKNLSKYGTKVFGFSPHSHSLFLDPLTQLSLPFSPLLNWMTDNILRKVMSLFLSSIHSTHYLPLPTSNYVQPVR